MHDPDEDILQTFDLVSERHAMASLCEQHCYSSWRIRGTGDRPVLMAAHPDRAVHRKDVDHRLNDILMDVDLQPRAAVHVSHLRHFLCRRAAPAPTIARP